MTMNFKIAAPKAKPISLKDVPAGTCFELTDPDTDDLTYMKLEATNVLSPQHRDIACVDLSSGRLSVLVCGPVRMVRLTVTGKEYI